MANRVITQELYDLVVEGFRKHGVNYTQVGTFSGVNPRTIAKVYEKGWPRKGFPAVKKVLQEEQLQARAKLQADHAAKIATQEKEREQARANAVQSRMQEGQMVTIARTTSLQTLVTNSRLQSLGLKLVDVVKKQVEADVAGGVVLPGQAVKLLQNLAQIGESIVRNAFQTMQMERLHLGQPTDVIAHVDGTQMDEMTFDDLQIRMAAFQQAIDSSKRQTQLELIEGGADVVELGVDMGADEDPGAAEAALVKKTNAG